jgi:hypothetical protein
MSTVLDITRRLNGVNLTADDWELYDLPGRDEAAQAINAALVQAFNTPGADRRSVTEQTYAVMNAYSRLGAIDSEGCARLGTCLDQLFDH